ncbi:restriction endonuclease subunit S [Streptomyces sp. PSRA5]|uniref:restriction endonuclease subunit S n=1 Tax=Streptomyces panacea TaxID=3035064 RepID=UPI00339CC8B2
MNWLAKYASSWELSAVNDEISVNGVRVPLDFPRVPAGWDWKSLNVLCEGIYDCPHSTPDLTDDGPYLARTQDFPDGALSLNGMAQVSRTTYLDRVRRAIPAHGDLLYSREGSYHGIAAEIPEDVEICMGQRMVLIRPDQDLLNFRFLKYWLNSRFVRDFISGMREGSGAPRINLPTVRGMAVPVPAVREQEAISSILGALDDKIAVNERIATVARSLAVSIGKRQISQIRGESASLGAYVSLVKGNSYKSADVGHGAQWLVSLKSIGRDGSYRPSGLKRFAGDFKPQQRLGSGEVVVAHTDLTQKAEVLARPVRVPEVGPEVHVASLDLAIVRPSRLLTNEYLLALLSREDFRNHALGFSNGTTVLHLSVKAVPSYEFVPPGEDLVDRVTAKMRPLLKRADASEKESETLSVLRDTLLPQLMSGRLRVKDAEKIVEDHV